MRKVNIGLIGCGNVGAGVVKWVQKNSDLIEARCNMQLEIAKIAVKNVQKDRGLSIDQSIFTADASTLVNAPDIDIVVELIGGIDEAKPLVISALKQGKPVVTANKSLLAFHGAELFKLAEDNNSDIYYEASVAGGISIIKYLKEGLVGNHINLIYGILNGTCNYILTRMAQNGEKFDDVLKEAQKLGFAEADPGLDIDGHDTAHKTCILASLAYGEWFEVDSIYVEGIRNLELQDIHNASEAGYTIKLLGIIKLNSGRVQMRAHPVLVPSTSLIAKVDNEFNAVWVNGDIVGDAMLYGRGAGQDPTTSAVVADIIDVALNIKCNSANRVAAFQPHKSYSKVLPMPEISSRYYLRLSLEDKPSVLANIARILGDANISIASVVQKESDSNKLPVILITHTAKEADINSAIEKIEDLSVVHGNPIILRIEDI